MLRAMMMASLKGRYRTRNPSALLRTSRVGNKNRPAMLGAKYGFRVKHGMTLLRGDPLRRASRGGERK